MCNALSLTEQRTGFNLPQGAGAARNNGKAPIFRLARPLVAGNRQNTLRRSQVIGLNEPATHSLGNVTTVSQNSSIDLTTSMKRLKSTGLEM